MSCIRCGRETAEGQTFCDTCKEIMDANPVKPGTPIQILPRPTATERRAAPKTAGPTQAEQLSRLRGVIRWLCGIIAVLSVLVCLLGVLLIRILDTQPQPSNIGKNYTTTGANP